MSEPRHATTRAEKLAVLADAAEELGLADVAEMLRSETKVVVERDLLGRLAERIRSDSVAHNHHYGSFMGGDPRDFSPDREACTPEEIAAWEAACAAAERDEPGARDLEFRSTIRAAGALIHVAHFGHGTSIFRDEEALALQAEVSALTSTTASRDTP